MALKPGRDVKRTDVSFFMSQTAERGFIAVFNTAGSGEAMDQDDATITVAASASGRIPVGMLLSDMVNIDQTRQRINEQKSEVQYGGKMPLAQQGWLVTNAISGTPSGTGEVAYLTASGYITPTFVNSAATPRVGNFESKKDEDGYAKVYINLPHPSN